jgi:hypothetical protein
MNKDASKSNGAEQPKHIGTARPDDTRSSRADRTHRQQQAEADA